MPSTEEIISPTGTSRSTTTARSLATAGTETNGSKRGSTSGRQTPGSSSKAPTGHPSSPNLSATSGCSSPTQPTSSPPTLTTADRPGCRYDGASGAKEAPGTRRSTRPFASKNPALTAGALPPAGPAGPARAGPGAPAPALRLKEPGPDGRRIPAGGADGSREDDTDALFFPDAHKGRLVRFGIGAESIYAAGHAELQGRSPAGTRRR